MKFDFDWPSGFIGEECGRRSRHDVQQCVVRRKAEAYLSYKLTNEPKGSGELKFENLKMSNDIYQRQVVHVSPTFS